MDHNLVTTGFDIPGKQITKSLGVVRGIVVRSRSVFGTIGGMLHSLVGGNITLFTTLCERTRQESYDLMIRHAQDVGGNAIVGVRYDTTELASGITEVICYGTAVVVK